MSNYKHVNIGNFYVFAPLWQRNVFDKFTQILKIKANMPAFGRKSEARNPKSETS